MPENRCDLILLGWTAFVGLNFMSDWLWGSSRGADSSDIGNSFSTWSSEIYRGQYRMQLNGSDVEEGSVRMNLATQQSGMPSVRVSSLGISMRKTGGRGGFSTVEPDIRFKGMEMGGTRKIVATEDGRSHRVRAFAGQPCPHLDTTIEFPGDSEALYRSPRHDLPATVGGHLSGGDCGVSISFSATAVDIMAATQKIVHYSIWTNIITIIQIRCYISQIRYTEEGAAAAKISMVCIGMQALMDASDSFLHLCLGLTSQHMFNTIAVISLFKFILFSLFEARYLLTIWRQRQPEIFSQGWDAVRRELSWLYSRFYGMLVIILIIVYHNLDRLDVMLVLFQAYWLPQIVHDTWQGHKNSFCPAYVLGISVSRLLLALYIYGCPNTIFNDDIYPTLPGTPNTSLCYWLVIVQLLQVGVMLSQKRWGPRWFVPWICMPWAYNYHRGDGADPGTDCVICMLEVDPEQGRRVVTPCNHVFHQTCLEQWMDIKMECPTCRTILPPIQ